LKYYVVKNGRKKGIYNSWSECEKQVKGFPNAAYKSFTSFEEASLFYNNSKLNVKNKLDNEEKLDLNKLDDDTMVAYIDGSYDSSLNTYSYASIIFLRGEKIEIYDNGKEEELVSMRNVAGEVTASVETIKYALNKNVKSLYIYYDYNGIEKWFTGEWKSNNPLTQEYSKFASEIKSKINISFIKVKSHTGDKYNEEVDLLAKKALLKKSNKSELDYEKIASCKINSKNITPVVNIVIDNEILNTALIMDKFKEEWKAKGNNLKDIIDLKIIVDSKSNATIFIVKTENESYNIKFNIKEMLLNE
jgi:viroplasmin and RNaseH domain-containing protein